jgi:LCP family protein required for cell wall assembly
MPPDDDGPPRGHRGGGGQGGKMRVLAWVSIGVTSLMVAGALTGYVVYRDAFGNIKQKSINDDIINPRPVDTGALNVLLVGSDTRAGEGNAKYGQETARKADGGGKRTDTIILLHISPDRDQARLISFPRDSMVQIPKCKNETTKQEMPPRRDMINSAYNSGGVACTISTLETLTGIRVNHFVEVDFSGFKNIVDALGGIEICLKSGVNDKYSKLVLPPGKSLLNGEKALGYVRLRKYGDGSDLQRIKRQQIFLSKVIAKATSSELMTDVGKLRNFIAAAAGSVTMDPALANDTEKLISIAMSTKQLTAKGVELTTVPVLPDPDNPEARVVWRQPDAAKLFTAIKTDTEVTEPSPSASASASAKPKVTPKPEQVRVHRQGRRGRRPAGRTGLQGGRGGQLRGPGRRQPGQERGPLRQVDRDGARLRRRAGQGRPAQALTGVGQGQGDRGAAVHVRDDQHRRGQAQGHSGDPVRHRRGLRVGQGQQASRQRRAELDQRVRAEERVHLTLQVRCVIGSYLPREGQHPQERDSVLRVGDAARHGAARSSESCCRRVPRPRAKLSDSPSV